MADEAHTSDLSVHLEDTRAQFFGPGEMKSSGVGSNVERRRKILASIVGCGAHFCAVVVDKASVDPDSGLQWKTSFIKYIHGRLYKRLYRNFTCLRVFADQHGHPEFMKSFASYLETRYKGQLLERLQFESVSSHTAVAVQAADMIAGSLLRVYSKRDPLDLLTLLQPAAIIVERWPPDAATPDVTANLSKTERYDHLIAEHGVTLARGYVVEHGETDDPDAQSRVDALRFLLYRYELEPNAYVERKVILDHVNGSRDEPLSMQAFSSNVIGRLRNEGILIASSNMGCKIPNCVGDMRHYVALVDGQVIPYIERLAVARQHLRVATTGDLDIVDVEAFPKLRHCMDALERTNPNKSVDHYVSPAADGE